MDTERQAAVAALQSRRAARGMNDPLNRLRAIAVGQPPIVEIPCPHCAPHAAASRVTLHRKAWGGSPAIWIGGACSDLQKLIAAGMVERLPSGWHIPTDLFPES